MPKEVPRSICFMVMPFSKKDTQAPVGKGPATLSFDSLWEKALKPLIEELGYLPVRADQDLGALIVHEMLERLAISDLVLADLSIPNGNVYYEIGVRHAAKERGCVLIGADWSRPLFDVDQLRRVVYPLPPEAVDDKAVLTDEAAATIRERLREGILALRDGVSPIHQVLPGYPTVDPKRASSFKDLMQEVAEFQGRILAVRRTVDPQQCALQARALRDEYLASKAALPALGLELLYLLRDCAGWPEVIDFVGQLPKTLQSLPVVREQLYLAQSKAGDHLEAIGALEKLIEAAGDTSERRGLLGGRYKKLYAEALKQGDKRQAGTYLDRAIEQYDLGMRLDLNDYYPASNLPRLLRTRGDEGDEERARAASAVARMGAERAKERGNDPWAGQTLLGLVFDDGNVTEARRLYKEVKREGAASWQLETTVDDLERSAHLAADPETQAQLLKIVEDLRELLPKK
ncbi:MAG TPA: tetratricopeptide repeat-containing protein [Thermoanaerobaculia bacterium]|nr:tetratricopeptide repeat-containing protein [Thermoanaerobaculia bacterium]